MNVSNFSRLLQEPENDTQKHIDSLKRVIEEYPYFQAARAIYLKALKEEESFKYNGELKRIAAYTADRSILFEYITSKAFNQHAIAKKIAQQTANEKLYAITVDTEELIVRDNKTSYDFDDVNARAVMDAELFQPKKKEEKNKEKPETKNNILRLGEPLQFDRSETHSFTEWMQLSSSVKPINREDDIARKPSEIKKEKKSSIEGKLKLINKFIETNPKIPPVNDKISKVNLAKENMAEKNELMTETLARIYLEQKKYKKAIQAYKILSLKYPEKSGFFADQINAIKKLKENN